ncbi:glutamate--tRNA ligase [Candidatus Falkowbacteria bacterium]|nr:glutamate--tRNA ligase [Candidatus Falkowbacteria bacterium]
MTRRVRTRFAPSPTGMMHVGGIRTALYSYLYAKQNGGDFLLRIEDTDRSRYVEGSVDDIINSLQTLGIINDEGPYLDGGVIKQRGPQASYYQSQRLEIYKKYVQILLDKGLAYYSFVSDAELEAIKADLAEKHKPLKRKHLRENYTPQEVNTKLVQGEKHVIRLALPESGKVTFTDMVRGDITYDYAEVDDQVLIKSDGFPTYHLAAVVDDIEMEISHVFRGEEWISSTPKHVFLYQAFEKVPPTYAHVSLLLNPDRTKLSKRQGDVATSDYLKKGYLPAALLNFIALLGWNPGAGSTQEIFSLDELLKVFDVGHIHKAGAVFDQTKLLWMNEVYLREKMSIDEVYALIGQTIVRHISGERPDITSDQDKLKYITKLIRERISILSQVDEWFAENQWIFVTGGYSRAQLPWKKSTPEATRAILSELIEFIDTLQNWEVSALESDIKGFISQKGYGVGDVLWPMRLALTGQDKSPNPFEVAYILGKTETLKRLRSALEL